MEVAIRTVRIYNRLFRKSIGIVHLRNVSNTAVKEEVNHELLNSFNQDIKAGGVVPIFRRALLFPTRVALQDDLGTYTYAGLHHAASELSQAISAQLVGDTERTVAYLCPNDATHIVVQWAIWMSGNIAVPLTSLHPAEMLKYFIQDCGASLVVCTEEHEKLLRPVALETSKPLLVTSREDGRETTASKQLQLRPKSDILADTGRSNMWYGNTEAMLIYTSGTTSKPKGVVWTHAMLAGQVSALHAAWRCGAADVALHALPLHHVHGQINSVAVTLAAGARLRMLPTFASHAVWARLLGASGGGASASGSGSASGTSGSAAADEPPVSVFHGVPAMYARLVADHERMFADARTAQYVRAALSARLRLACVGSAPLPAALYRKWEEISGSPPLERYGMSEAGMALSNPYRPAAARAAGAVGAPLPGVAARVAVDCGGVLEPRLTVECAPACPQISLERLGLLSPAKGGAGAGAGGEGGEWAPPVVTEHRPSVDGAHEGELLLKGPGLFTRYWNRAPQVSSPDFTLDGWFRTGDTVSYSDGRFRILGRTSVDIIKTGGYKVSALEVESAILDHPSVADAAVLGAAHDTQGEVVVAAVTLKDQASLTLAELKDFTGKRLAPYQLPRRLLVIDQMPRNAMGKLDKKELRAKYGKQLRLKQ